MMTDYMGYLPLIAFAWILLCIFFGNRYAFYDGGLNVQAAITPLLLVGEGAYLAVSYFCRFVFHNKKQSNSKEEHK